MYVYVYIYIDRYRYMYVTSNCCSLAYASAVLRTSAIVRGAAHCKPRDARYRPRSGACRCRPAGNGAGALLSLSVASEVDQRRCCSVLLRPAARVKAADAAQRRFACLETGCAETVPTVCGGPQFSLEKRVFRAERDQHFLGAHYGDCDCH